VLLVWPSTAEQHRSAVRGVTANQRETEPWRTIELPYGPVVVRSPVQVPLPQLTEPWRLMLLPLGPVACPGIGVGRNREGQDAGESGQSQKLHHDGNLLGRVCGNAGWQGHAKESAGALSAPYDPPASFFVAWSTPCNSL